MKNRFKGILEGAGVYATLSICILAVGVFCCCGIHRQSPNPKKLHFQKLNFP